MATLFYQGHGSFRLETAQGKVIYVDPFAGEGYDKPADLILVTHDHYDHNCIDKPARAPGCALITWKEALEGGHYGQFTLGDIQVQAVPAGNKNHDPSCCVGFVITLDGVTVYASGDTSLIPAMEEILAPMKLDYAILPIDGVYNMDASEASHCAAVIGARHSIPVHTCPSDNGLLYDPENAARFQCDGRILVSPGETISLQQHNSAKAALSQMEGRLFSSFAFINLLWFPLFPQAENRSDIRKRAWQLWLSPIHRPAL